MNVFEMEGFLRGKCLPGDMKVNETTAEYLVRKLSQSGELTAAHSTIEKAREVTNCPQGVDLQDHLKQLVAENLAMKVNATKADAVIMQSKFDYWSDRVELSAVVGRITESTATDSLLRELEVRVWLEAKDFTKSMLLSDSVDHLDFLFDGKVQQLREGKA